MRIAVLVTILCAGSLWINWPLWATSVIFPSQSDLSSLPQFDIIHCGSPRPPAEDLTLKARAALERNEYEEALILAQQIVEQYQSEARNMQAPLQEYPWRNKEEIFRYWPLNAVAVALFIEGKSYQELGNLEKADRIFADIISNYTYGQCFHDEGWFFKPAEYAMQERDFFKKILESGGGD